MKKRVITAAVLLAILLPILWFSEHIPFVAVLAVFSCIAVYEALRCFGVKPHGPTFWPLYTAAAALPFLIRYAPGETLLKYTFVSVGLIALYVFTLTTITTAAPAFSKAAAVMAFVAYIIAGINAIIIVRDNVEYNGRFMFMLILLGAWVTDGGAQFAGIAFGKHKLIPKVSPHKTVEGAIGGVVAGLAGFCIYALIVEHFYDIRVNYTALLIFGLVITVTDQVGDLIASCVKREQGIKDYGTIFPGHGGVIDRVDSIVANALVTLAYVTFGLPGIF